MLPDLSPHKNLDILAKHSIPFETLVSLDAKTVFILSTLIGKALAQMVATSVESLRECSNLLTREVKDQLEATDPVPDSETCFDIWVEHPLQERERERK